MTITLNYNDYRIEIADKINNECHFELVKDIHQFRQILEEILNRIDYSKLSSATPYLDIELEVINEDSRTTVGEW